MYHIKNDKRSRTSAQLISEALLKCLYSKEFNQITITDIQRESSVGRATFYRLFDNLSDVLAYQCDKVFDEAVLNHKDNPKESSEEVFVFFAEHWMKHQILLDTIVSCNRLDILHESHRKNTDKLKTFFYPELDIDPVQIDYLLGILTAAMAGVLATWVKHGKKQTSRELFQNVKRSSQLFYGMFN